MDSIWLEEKIISLSKTPGNIDNNSTVGEERPCKFLAKPLIPFSYKLVVDTLDWIDQFFQNNQPPFQLKKDWEKELNQWRDKKTPFVGDESKGLYELARVIAGIGEVERVLEGRYEGKFDEFFKMFPCIGLEVMRAEMKSNDINSIMNDNSKHFYLIYQNGRRFLSCIVDGKLQAANGWSTREAKTIGICLSGGGYRATLYHLGVLWKLNREGVLRKADTITGVSGGAIALGVLACQWMELKNRDFTEQAFVDLIAKPIISITENNIMFTATAASLFVKRSRIIPQLESMTNDLHVKFSEKLDRLPKPDDTDPNEEIPLFVFCACDSYKGEGLYFRFDGAFEITGQRDEGKGMIKAFNRQPKKDVELRANQKGSSWSKIKGVDPTKISISEAIAASAAFPLAFNPVEIPVDEGKIISAVDGGVYDNLGIDPLLLPRVNWDDRSSCHDIIYASDAGAPFAHVELPSSKISQGIRTIDIISNQITSLRHSKFVGAIERGRFLGAKCSLQNVMEPPFWRLFQEKYPISEGFIIPDEFYRSLSNVRTQLDSFTVAERAMVVNAGYLSAHNGFKELIIKVEQQRGDISQVVPRSKPPMKLLPDELKEIKDADAVVSFKGIARRIPGYSWFAGKNRTDEFLPEN